MITGAAGGIGAAYARSLALRGYRLVLSDMDADGVADLAEELGARSVVGNLTRTEDLELLTREVARLDDLELLVNNAGFGTYAMFADADLSRQVDMVNVHVVASMALMRAALPGMIAKGRGEIVNVASAGAFMRFPRDATYIGTKSFLVAFSECLSIELAGTGVTVQALCPAWVRTAFSAKGDFAAIGYRSPIPDWLFCSPEDVVASSLRALGHRVVHIPTLRARVAVLALGSRPGLAVLSQIRSRRRASPGDHG